MEYLCKYKVYRLEILQGWCVARTTYCHSDYDITMATYSLPDLYLPKMKTALFVSPEFNRLSCARAVHIRSQPQNDLYGQITLPQGRKLWFSPLNGKSLELIALPWECQSRHIMEQQLTKFQFYTEKLVRNIQFFCDFAPLGVHIVTSQVM